MATQPITPALPGASIPAYADPSANWFDSLSSFARDNRHVSHADKRVARYSGELNGILARQRAHREQADLRSMGDELDEATEAFDAASLSITISDTDFAAAEQRYLTARAAYRSAVALMTGENADLLGRRLG